MNHHLPIKYCPNCLAEWLKNLNLGINHNQSHNQSYMSTSNRKGRIKEYLECVRKDIRNDPALEGSDQNLVDWVLNIITPFISKMEEEIESEKDDLQNQISNLFQYEVD